LPEFLLSGSLAMMLLPFAGNVVETNSNDRCSTLQNVDAGGGKFQQDKPRFDHVAQQGRLQDAWDVPFPKQRQGYGCNDTESDNSTKYIDR